MTFSLKSFFVLFAFVACLLALVISRWELAQRKQHHLVDTRIVDGNVGISMLNNNNFLARVGKGCELRFRFVTEHRAVAKREVLEEFQLGPGLYSVCLINDKKSSLFGCCVNDQLHVHSVPKDLDSNWMGFGAGIEPNWQGIWHVGKLGGDQFWGVELQKAYRQVTVDHSGAN